MSVDLWAGTPVFTAGQYISAAGQLAALADAANLIYDRAVGPNVPFSGAYLDGSHALAYALRHKANTLRWLYELYGTGHLAVNGQKVAATERTGSGGALATGTSDIAALELVTGGFYELSFVVTAGTVGLWLAAETATNSVPTLATFADGTTPTADQWNALSAYLDTLHAETAQPRAPFVAGSGDIGPGGGTVRIWRGALVHRTNTLAYKFALRAPWNKCDGGGRWITAHIYAAPVGGPWHEVVVQTATAGNAETVEFAGTASLAAAGLTFGHIYRLAVDIESCSCWDTAGKKGQVVFLAEIADAAPALSGWTKPPRYAYPAYLSGFNVLAANLPAVRAHYGAAPHNYAVRPYPGALTAPNTQTEAYTTIRQHRWLHYVCASAEDTPRLTYHTGEQEQSVTLTAATEWQVLDLSAQAGLYPGLRYRIDGVKWALEDTVA